MWRAFANTPLLYFIPHWFYSGKLIGWDYWLRRNAPDNYSWNLPQFTHPDTHAFPWSRCKTITENPLSHFIKGRGNLSSRDLLPAFSALKRRVESEEEKGERWYLRGVYFGMWQNHHGQLPFTTLAVITSPNRCTKSFCNVHRQGMYWDTSHDALPELCLFIKYAGGFILAQSDVWIFSHSWALKETLM